MSEKSRRKSSRRRESGDSTGDCAAVIRVSTRLIRSALEEAGVVPPAEPFCGSEAKTFADLLSILLHEYKDLVRSNSRQVRPSQALSRSFSLSPADFPDCRQLREVASSASGVGEVPAEIPAPASDSYVRSLQLRLQELNTENTKLQRSLASLNRQLDSARKQRQDADDTHRQTLERMEATQLEAAALEHRLADAEALIARLRASSGTGDDKAVARRLTDLQAHMERQKRALQDAKFAAARRITELETENRKLLERLHGRHTTPDRSAATTRPRCSTPLGSSTPSQARSADNERFSWHTARSSVAETPPRSPHDISLVSVDPTTDDGGNEFRFACRDLRITLHPSNAL